MTIAVNYLWVNKGCLFVPGEPERRPVKEPQDQREREGAGKQRSHSSPGSFWEGGGKLIWPFKEAPSKAAGPVEQEQTVLGDLNQGVELRGDLRSLAGVFPKCHTITHSLCPPRHSKQPQLALGGGHTVRTCYLLQISILPFSAT